VSIAAFHRAVQGLLTPSSTFKTAIGGRFYHQEEVPQNTAMPYAAWFTVFCEPQDTFTARIDERMIQVDVFSANLAECITVADKASDLFEDAILAGAGIQPARLVRRAKHGPMKTEDNGRKMILEYSVHVQTP